MEHLRRTYHLFALGAANLTSIMLAVALVTGASKPTPMGGIGTAISTAVPTSVATSTPTAVATPVLTPTLTSPPTPSPTAAPRQATAEAPGEAGGGGSPSTGAKGANTLIGYGVDVPVIDYSDCSGQTFPAEGVASIFTCVTWDLYFIGHNPGVFTPLVNMPDGTILTYYDGSDIAHPFVIEGYVDQGRPSTVPEPPAGATAQFQTCLNPSGSEVRMWWADTVGASTPTPTPLATATPMATPTPTPAPPSTPTPAPMPAPPSTPTPAPTPAPSSTPTSALTPTPAPRSTPTPTPASTATPSASPSSA